MSASQLEIQLIAIMVAVACALPGVFLILRRLALLSDAISHAILLGIVLGFFLVQDLASPVLVLAATATGVLTVALVEVLSSSRLVKTDAAIGLVFPLLFSVGIILISRYAGGVHLDTDAVLLGELAFAPFNRLELFGVDIGPKSLWVMGGILLLNLIFILIFYKELKLATFDAALAASLGFSPVLIHYALMTLVSVTAVGAFDAVGSILVVAIMIAPPATAYLLTDKLSRMLLLSAAIAAAAAVSGYWVAHALDTSIAGSIATMTGVLFLLAYLLAPGRGLIAGARRRLRQRWDFAQAMLAIHLFTHESLPEAETECRVDHLQDHLRWEQQFADRVVARAVRQEIVTQTGAMLNLTSEGRELAKQRIMA